MDLSSYQSFLDSLLIVLVLYKSDLETSESFQSIEACLKTTSNVVDVFIYDNSPQQLDFSLNQYNSKIRYVWDSSNPGVGKAYNEGFTIAENEGKKWLLILDQDTEFDSDFLIKYYGACTSNPNLSLFAPILKLNSGEIYSPCTYTFPRTAILKKIDIGITELKNLSLLNSGMLIGTNAFKEVGGYDERLKMDFTDFEFIDRYRNIYDCFFVVNTIAIHGFSGFQDKLDASLARFSRYCQSFTVMCSIRSSLMDKTMLITIAFLRSIRLSFNFRNITFVSVFLEFLIFSKTNKDVDII
jgi:rhamnosyltransferase